VKQILKDGLDQQQLDLALGPVLEPPYLGANRFSRTPPDTLH
jgi:hypothetical protein